MKHSKESLLLFVALLSAFGINYGKESIAEIKPEKTWALADPIESGVLLPSSISHDRAPLGYSVGNFGVAAVISQDGLEITDSLMNPPVLGEWLEPLGHGKLSLMSAGHADFKLMNSYSVFPENAATLKSTSTQVEAAVRTFSPISASDSFDNFIPALIIGVELRNAGTVPEPVSLSYNFSAKDTSGKIDTGRVTAHGSRAIELHQSLKRGQIWLMSATHVPAREGSSEGRRSQPNELTRKVEINIKPGKTEHVWFVVGIYDQSGYTSNKLDSLSAMEKYILEGLWPSTSIPSGSPGRLSKEYTVFVRSLPRTGDPEMDVYSRWYLSAAILMTKGVRSGEVVTMGYRELNQRDSYWSSGAHLIFWPDLERKMLQESMAAQLDTGQIPLTILPTINRAGNIDGNEYFVLRLSRYYRWYRDKALLEASLPPIKRAISYLVSLDTDRIGLPKQVSYWADWKDVPGAEGKLYAPHFELLWLATLKEAKFMATEAQDTSLANQLNTLYDRAYERINRNFSDGGLWDDSRYVDVWSDGRPPKYTMEDQTLSAPFNVIPPDRLQRIYSTLDRDNDSPYGVRETFPYISHFNQNAYGPAEYHNGGIWPYMNCVDAWGRFLNHREEEAEQIIKKVGYNGLARTDKFLPVEFLNGDTGKTSGFSIQGWDAACFSATYFGAFGLNRTAADMLEINVHLPLQHTLETDIRVPEGTFTLKRKNGSLCVENVPPNSPHIILSDVKSSQEAQACAAIH